MNTRDEAIYDRAIADVQAVLTTERQRCADMIHTSHGRAKRDFHGSVIQARRLASYVQDLRKVTPAARNWVEDRCRENGNYSCQCVTCGSVFIGHKRRVTCKICTEVE